MRCHRLAFALATLVLPTVAVAQVEADSGRFRLFLRDEPIGWERFLVRETGSGLATEVTAIGESERQRTFSETRRSKLVARGLPPTAVRYEAEIHGTETVRLQATVQPLRLSVRRAVPVGEELRELFLLPDAVVLDEDAVHLYRFLAQRTRAGTVELVDPVALRRRRVRVRSEGETTVPWGRARIVLYRLRLEFDDRSVVYVWVDALNRVYRLERPADGFRAEREPPPAR